MPSFTDEEYAAEVAKIQAAATTASNTELDSLRNKNTELLDEKKKAKTAKDDAEALTETTRLEALKKEGNHKALADSWEKKHDTLTAQIAAGAEIALNAKKKVALDKVASGIAGHFKDANFATPMINTRLTTSTDEDGQIHVKTLDANGQSSALTVAELQAELIASADKSLLKGPNSGGGDASGNGGKIAPVVAGVTKSGMTKQERSAAHQAKLDASLND